MDKWKKILPVVLIGIGVGSFVLFVKFRKIPPRHPVVVHGPLVRVARVHVVRKPVMIEGYGTVRPEHELQLVSQVSGKVVAVSPHFIDGGMVKKGEVLIQIDPSDYEIALKRAEAALLKEDVAYRKALKQAHIAKKEWEEILGSVLKGRNVVPDVLTLYIPQLKAAKAAYDAAEAGVQLARLNLNRTTLKAPYQGRVLERTTDLGQFVSPGKPLGSLFCTDQADVIVPLHPQDVAWLKVPSPAVVISTLRGIPVRYPARLVRTGGRLDPRSRMMRAIVKVKNPRRFAPPLEDGDFVRVRMEGKKAEGAWIPAKVERAGKVWLAVRSHLVIRKVRVLYRRTSEVLVSGLKEGDKLITSSLFAVTNGMKIRVKESEAP